jgi:hypothetical protein
MEDVTTYQSPASPLPMDLNQKISEDESTKTEAEKNVYGLNMEMVKNMVLESQNESQEAFRDIRKEWDDCWNAYICYQDYSDKKKWQAKAYIPELAPAIRKAVSLIRRILFGQEEYFDLVDPITESSDLPYIEGQKKAIRIHHDRIYFKDSLIEAIEAGFTFGIGILKQWWEPKVNTVVETSIDTDMTMGHPMPYQEQVTWESSTLQSKAVDPRNIWMDPEGTYLIEESITSLPEVQRLAKSGLYDQDVVDKLISMDYGTDSEKLKRLQELNIAEHQNSFKKRVHLYEYWGPIYDRKGQVVKENARVVVANKQYVLNPNNLEHPFRFFGELHNKPPYVIFSPIMMLFRDQGRSLISDALSLQKYINTITNMSLDGLLWKLMKLFEVDPERLRNPDTLKNLRPGKPILIQGQGNAIREVAISDIPRGVFAETEVLRRSAQNAHGVTDFLMALSPSKGSTTKGEVVIKTQESNSLFEGIGRAIETQLIEPAIEMSRQLTIQYWDDNRDPVLRAIGQTYGLPFSQNTKEGRMAFMTQTVQVKSRGISSYFQKQMERNDLMQFLGVMAKVPPMYQRLELRELQDRIINTFSFPNPSKLLISPEKEKQLQAQEQAERQARIQALQAQGQQPGAPGPGPSPTPPSGGNGGMPMGPPQGPPPSQRPALPMGPPQAPGKPPNVQQLGMPTTMNMGQGPARIQ